MNESRDNARLSIQDRAAIDTELVEELMQLDKESARAVLLIAKAMKQGGKPRDRAIRGLEWIERPEVENLTHNERVTALEAIATGHLDGLPDYIADSLQEVINP